MTTTNTLITALANVAKVNVQLSTRNLEVLRTARQLNDDYQACKAELAKATADLTIANNDLANLKQAYIALQADLDAANAKLATIPAPVTDVPVAVRRPHPDWLRERCVFPNNLPPYDGEYNLLNVGDIIQIGDEYWDYIAGRWVLTDSVGFPVGDPSLWRHWRRRNLSPSDIEGLPDGCIVGPDHALVESGEALQSGMERWDILHGWHTVVVADGAVWLKGAPHRKLKQYPALPEGVEIGDGYEQLYLGQKVQEGDELLLAGEWDILDQRWAEEVICAVKIGYVIRRRK